VAYRIAPEARLGILDRELLFIQVDAAHLVVPSSMMVIFGVCRTSIGNMAIIWPACHRAGTCVAAELGLARRPLPWPFLLRLPFGLVDRFQRRC